MNSNGKKISFGFSKLSKKPNVINPDKEKDSVELIDCLEGAEIRVKNAIKKVEKSPLVIPIKGGANNIVHQIEHGSLKNKKKEKDIIDEDLRPDSELTIEELAARQLLREARQKLEHNKDTTKVHVLPLEGNKTIQDAVEPSMDDYENVPIGDFGLACLRGMGWKEGDSIGKNPSKFVKPAEPDLRPKGLGLGAQKIIDFQAKDVFDGNGKKLVLAKGSFGKIVAGSHKGKFCEIQFCHEWSGRVDVKLSNSNEILTLPELLVTPVSKDDYIRGSKVINNAKFEQYKQMQENEEFSNRKMIVEEMKQMKQEPESRKQESSSRNHFAIKQEFKKDIPLDTAASSDDEKYKSKDAKDPRYRKESKSNHRKRGSRNKYSEMNDSKQNKYDGQSSEENSSRSRSTDSSNRYYDKSKSNPKNTEHEEIKIKSRQEGVESGSSHSRKKSKTRRRNRSRSSSEGYNDSMEKRNISKGERKDYRKYPNEKVKNEKNDYDREKSKKYAKSRNRGEGTYEEKHKKKSKKYRKDRESSSE